ncbi:MAG: 7TM diverse intracellular signaling domain-containing protein [Methylococcaceae bacterium]
MLVGWLIEGTVDAKGCPTDPIILTTQFSVLEDPGRTLTIEKVSQPDVANRFRPNVDGRNNFGMSRSAFWIRIKPMMPPGCSQGWLLAIAWPLLGNVEFYWPENAHWAKITTGAQYPYHSRDVDHQYYVFRLPDLSDDRPPFFMRVAGDNPLLMAVGLWQQETFTHHASSILLLQGMYLGLFIGLILYNLFFYFSLRDTAYLYYVIYLISAMLLTTAYTGIATRYLWPDSPNWNLRAMWTFALSGTIAFLTFIRRLLDTSKIAPKLDLTIRWCILVLLLAMVALFIVDYSIMASIPPLLSIVGFSISGIAIIISIKNGYRPAYFVGLANVMFVSCMLWAIYISFGLSKQVWEWNLYIFEFGVAVEAVLLALALASRIKILQHQKSMAQQTLLESKHHFSNQLIAAQDAERRHISNELHDGIGQNLMVINNRLNRLTNADLSPHLAEQLDFASGVTQQTIHDLRGLSHRLHPHQLDRLGLAIAIETVANETLSEAGIILNCQIDAIDHLVNKDQALHVYRIVQEAIKNIIRHAEADTVTISLISDNNAIALSISDNGQGINAIWLKRKDFSQAFGLSSIQERVQFLAGTFDIFNTNANGLTLEICVPLVQNEPHD